MLKCRVLVTTGLNAKANSNRRRKALIMVLMMGRAYIVLIPHHLWFFNFTNRTTWVTFPIASINGRWIPPRLSPVK